MPAVPTTVDALLAARAEGRHLGVVAFWGHRPQADGRLGPSCLSQWWRAPTEVDGRRFDTAEHRMMWEKARLFGDEDAAAAVLAAPTPGDAKGVGRRVRGFDHDVWERERFGIVVAASRAKFGQHPRLAAYLRSTGDATLVEASPVDPIWGIGAAASDPRTRDPAQWPGLNLLGFALMLVRGELGDGR